MSGLMDLFDVGDFNQEKKKDTKGKGKKESDKKSSKKETAKKGVRYPLPIHVSAGHIRCVISEKEYDGKTVSEEDLKKIIRGKYRELKNIEFNLVKFSNSYTEKYTEPKEAETRVMEEDSKREKADVPEDKLLDFAAAESEEDQDEVEDNDAAEKEETGKESSAETTAIGKGCWIKLEIKYKAASETKEITLPVTVQVGDTLLEITGAVKTIKEIQEEWISAHPEYKGCRFHYDEEQKLLLPYMKGENEIKGKKYNLPVRVGYLDEMETYQAEDFGNAENKMVTQEQIRALFAVKHPEFENAIFAFQEENNTLFPVMNFKQADSKEKYMVPIKVRGSGFVLDLSCEDFSGKDAVSLEEVRQVLEEVYPEFSKERTEMIYDERGFVIPVLKGAKKGLKITSVRDNQRLFYTLGRDGKNYRIEQMPYGFFDCREDGSCVDFHLSAAKIPGIILQEIINFFKEDPSKEAAAQIFYDVGKKEYQVYFPRQKTTACSVVFERDAELEQEKILVMDIHSHGRMCAFFSPIDDHDEKGTRLFLVIGQIDKEVPAWKFRAGIAGFYKELMLSEVFDIGGKDFEKNYCCGMRGYRQPLY